MRVLVCVLFTATFLATKQPCCAQDNPEAEFQSKMAEVVVSIGAAKMAVACGLRPESFELDISARAIETTYKIASEEWPSETRGISDAAEAAAEEMAQEFLDAASDNKYPTTDQCAALDTNGILQRMDAFIAAGG